MSVQAISYILGDRRGGVWITPPHPARGAARLVLIAIANHASEDRMEAWPSIELVAAEAGLSKGRTQIALRSCIERGWLERDVNAAPDERIRSDRRTNLYRIVVLDGVIGTDTPSVPRGARNEPDGGVETDAHGVSVSTPLTISEPPRIVTAHDVAVARAARLGRVDPSPNYLKAIAGSLDRQRLCALAADGLTAEGVDVALERPPSMDEPTLQAQLRTMEENARWEAEHPTDQPTPEEAAPLIAQARAKLHDAVKPPPDAANALPSDP